MTRKALITGISGQDGGYLTELLTGQGVEVHGLDRSASYESQPWLAEAVVHQVDLTDADAVSDVVAAVRPNEIYNLAAVSSVARSWEYPVETAMVNGMAVAVLLEAADRLRREGHDIRVVQAASAEIFGAAPHAPQDEQTPIAPVNPYGASKAYAHHLTAVYRARGLHANAVVLYGHESVRRPATFVTRKITSTVAAIVAGTADRLVLGALDVRRDWGWAPEYVDAMSRVARADQPGDFVLATGIDASIADFVDAAFRHAGIADYQDLVSSDDAFKRPGDATLQVGNAAKAARVLGWRPTTVFPEVVHKMVDADLAAVGARPRLD